MNRKPIGVAMARGCAAAGLALVWLSGGGAHASEAACGRACLRQVLDGYIGAVFKHDVAAAPLAAHARATLNAAPLGDGEGIWRTLTGYGPVQRRYFDTQTGQALYYGLMDEGGQTNIVALRVKVDHHHVAEAEWTVARAGSGGMFSDKGLADRPPPPDTSIPPGERTPRARMIATANAYFDGLESHDGSQVPHIPGCDRLENGVKVTNRDSSAPLTPLPGAASPPAPGPVGGAPTAAQETGSGDCTSGFQVFSKSIVEAAYRRYLVDEQAGVVVGATLFHRPPGSPLKRNLLTELFWEKNGQISAIYAAMYYLDPAAPDTPGW
jgi:hypothetical protein